MNIMCTFARVVGAARDKTHNSFSVRGGIKVAHHCFRLSLNNFLALCKKKQSSQQNKILFVCLFFVGLFVCLFV